MFGLLKKKEKSKEKSIEEKLVDCYNSGQLSRWRQAGMQWNPTEATGATWDNKTLTFTYQSGKMLCAWSRPHFYFTPEEKILRDNNQ